MSTTEEEEEVPFRGPVLAADHLMCIAALLFLTTASLGLVKGAEPLPFSVLHNAVLELCEQRQQHVSMMLSCNQLDIVCSFQNLSSSLELTTRHD